MNEEIGHRSRLIVSLLLCASMVLGVMVVGSGNVRAADDAIFNGTVTIASSPAPDTLIMYSVGSDQNPPSGNSTVTDSSGLYEIWVEGGATYYLYYANGGAMFDLNSMSVQTISPGETITVDVDLTPAPAPTATLMGYVNNATNLSEYISGVHALGMRMAGMGDQPDYINWSATDGMGYYEVKVLPGNIMAAVFDAPGYLPGMAPSSGSPLYLGDGESGWLNISLTPLGMENVNVNGTVRDINTDLPVANALVEIQIYGAPFSYSNYTDSSGWYTMKVMEGQGELTVSADGYVPQRQTDTYFVGNMTLDYWLGPVNAAIIGHVYDALTSLPISNATVECSQWIENNTNMFNRTTTGLDGSYGMGVTAGSWNAMAGAQGYGRSWQWTMVGVGEVAVLDFYLVAETSIIKGIVSDSVSGDPIPKAMIRIEEYNGSSNSTASDDAGYYEIYCGPGMYRMLFVGAGYMWEMQQDYETAVGVSEIVWVNHSLDLATTEVYGDVSDAITLVPLDGVQIQIGSVAKDPDYFRIMMTTSAGGHYSVMIAPDPWTMFGAYLTGYEDYQTAMSVPDVPAFEHSFYMVPLGGTNQTYTLMGYVYDNSSGSPISLAHVQAFYPGEVWFWSTPVNDTYTDGLGYYEMEVPAMVLDVMASMNMYLPVTTTVTPGPAGGWKQVDFYLDWHSDPPLVSVTVQPETVSLINHGDMFATIIEPYLNIVGLDTFRLVNETANYAWLELAEEGMYLPLAGPMNQLQGSEVSPGVWEIGLWDWPGTTFSDKHVLVDAATSYKVFTWASEDWMGNYWVWGTYRNLSGSWGAQAVFGSDGAFLYIDFGSGPDWGATYDPNGRFFLGVQMSKLNLTTMQIEETTWVPSEEMVPVDMILDLSGTYPSGAYAAVSFAWDQAWNFAMNYSMFNIDNEPPVANAGLGQTVIENVIVTLDGSASADNIAIVEYMWEFDDNGPVTLYGVSNDYAFSELGNHTITLTVTDAGGYQSVDTTWIDVVADVVPTADAGLDQTVDEDTLVAFDGSGSWDDLGITNYTWAILVQATGSLLDYMYNEYPEYTFATPGVYRVELVVTDTIGQTSAPDSVLITVNDLTPPVADAGLDLDVGLNSVVTLDGSGSSDNSGSIDNYTWTFDDGGLQTLYGVSPQYTFNNLGQFTVTLTVSDAAGLTDTDEVLVTVTDNVNPVARAGSDVTIVLGDTMHFDGSASTDNVGIVSWTWTFTDGVAKTLTGETVDYEFTTTGAHIVTLTVEDAEGNSGIDTLVVTVNAPNAAPVANAGSDQTVEADTMVTFNGGGSTDDVGVTNYTWTFTYDGETKSLYGAAPHFAFEIAGTYTVTLTVRDGGGLTDTDTVTITVTEKEKAKSFVEQYWWAFVVAAIVVVGVVLYFVLGKRGKAAGEKPGAEEELEEREEPPPPEDSEL